MKLEVLFKLILEIKRADSSETAANSSLVESLFINPRLLGQLNKKRLYTTKPENWTALQWMKSIY